MNFALYPVAFYAAVLLIAIGIAYCGTGLRQGWGLPGIVVMLTIAAWYVGDALYNDYEAYYWEFGKNTLERAWWQVASFAIVFVALVKPMHDLVNGKVPNRDSFAIKSYRLGLVSDGAVQQQIDRIFGLLFAVWSVLMVVALARCEWDVLGLFAPYIGGGGAAPWMRGRLGGQFDALLSLAKFVHIFLTAAFGLIWAVSHNPRTRTLAGICFLLSAPIFIFGRARNVMLAVAVPGLLAWVIIRLRTTWLVRSVVLLAAFLIINFWMLFVLENRAISIAQAFQLEESFEGMEDAEHKGLNMFKELSFINRFIEQGVYQPNWGARYWAEIVNPIPRGLWPGKPTVGLDYARLRGMGEGGVAESAQEGVAATISTGLIGQGVVNFGIFLGPLFAALLMAAWVALLARQDLLSEEHPARFLLFAMGIILTFNMGRDITFIVAYPFFFGYALVYYFEHKKNVGFNLSGRENGRTGGGKQSVKGSNSHAGSNGVGPEFAEETYDLRRDVGTGGTVRTMPMHTPKRIARWMPRRLRAAVVAAQSAAEEEAESGSALRKDGGSVEQQEQQKGPRQLGVPFQNYRRYRG